MSVGDPGFEPGTMASMDKFRLFYLPGLIAPAGLSPAASIKNK